MLSAATRGMVLSCLPNTDPRTPTVSNARNLFIHFEKTNDADFKFRYQWKKFGITMTWATTVWIGGFICRAISVYDVQNLNMFIAQLVLVIVGPPLYAASEYFILGRLFAYLPYYTPIHPGRVVSTFLFLSALVESLTAVGASHSTGDDRNVGLILIKAALLLQCCVEVLFFSLVVVLDYRCRRSRHSLRQLRPVFYVLEVTSLMMLVRCTVRAADSFEDSVCSTGYCGYIELHVSQSEIGCTTYIDPSVQEWTLYVFEVANITLFVILLTIFHPGRYLPRSSKVYLDPLDGKTERIGPGFAKADKRPLVLTIFDPFNLQSIFSRNRLPVHHFWEEQHPIYEGGELRPHKTDAESSPTIPMVTEGERYSVLSDESSQPLSGRT